MLDIRTKYLLEYIVRNCESGNYTIFQIEDLINCFPKKFKIDNISLEQILIYLKERNYIEIKHSDEKCYCVTIFPKARIECESDENLQKIAKKIKKIAFFAIIMAFFGAIIGGMIGAIIVKLFF